MTLQMTSGNDNWFTNEMFLQCAKYSEEIAFRHGMQGLTTTKAGTVSVRMIDATRDIGRVINFSFY